KKSRSGDVLRARIRVHMARSGIRSATELAKKAEVSPGGFLAFMRGETDRPWARTLDSLARALGVTVPQLIGDADPQASLPRAPISLNLFLDPEDHDVFQAIAMIHGTSSEEEAEEALAVAARRL